MANQEHLDIIKQGVKAWNQWRGEHPEVQPDLSGADLSGALLSHADLEEADLSRTDLSDANLREADLSRANLREANLSGTNLIKADLWRANLIKAVLYKATTTEADLSEAKLNGAKLSEAALDGVDFREADLSSADLTKADLTRATLVDTNLTGATLTQCRVYGISVWNVELEGAKQENLAITHFKESEISVDNLEVAQFIYLLLNNPKIREVIDTVAKKAVLILGRFTPERKALLDALREALRTHGYLPMLFDFEKPSSRNLTETVRTLAHLSRFIIADLTDPSSIPQELYAIVPTLAVPVRPVLLEGKKEYAMSLDLLSTYHWMLPIHFYKDQADLLATLKEEVIEPAEQKAQELEKR